MSKFLLQKGHQNYSLLRLEPGEELIESTEAARWKNLILNYDNNLHKYNCQVLTPLLFKIMTIISITIIIIDVINKL